MIDLVAKLSANLGIIVIMSANIPKFKPCIVTQVITAFDEEADHASTENK